MAVGIHGRATLLQSLALPRGLYASSVTHLPRALLCPFRTGVTKALWGGARKFRCREVMPYF
eukprot:574629-Karenia_brevis.AAC.1